MARAMFTGGARVRTHKGVTFPRGVIVQVPDAFAAAEFDELKAKEVRVIAGGALPVPDPLPSIPKDTRTEPVIEKDRDPNTKPPDVVTVELKGSVVDAESVVAAIKKSTKPPRKEG